MCLLKGSYVGFRLCSSLEQTKKEIQITLDIFEDNGNDQKMLQAIADKYEPPTTKKQKNHSNVNNTIKTNNTEKKTIDFFRALPF